MPRSTGRRGFTLSELLVVLAILGVVLALVLTALVPAHSRSRRSRDYSHLKELALASLQAYERSKTLPPAYGPYGGKEGGVLFHLLPFVEEEEVYRDPDPGRHKVRCYLSPFDTTAGDGLLTLDGTTYGAASFGWNDACSRLRMPDDFMDGMSHTILFAEKAAVCGFPAMGAGQGQPGGNVWWQRPPAPGRDLFSAPFYSPILPGPREGSRFDPTGDLLPQFGVRPNNCDPYRASTVKTQGILAAFADGSVRQFAPAIGQPTALGKTDRDDGRGKRSVWLTLLTPADFDNRGEERLFFDD